MTIIIYLLLGSMLYYAGMILWFIAGNLFSDSQGNSKDSPAVSVIIAIRNGEKSLPNLLADLSAQDYPGEVEFILVDDESIDSTRKLIQEISEVDKRIILENSSNGDTILNYKKRALNAGIKRAKNEWLLFTDVDCRLNPGWVTGMATYFEDDVDYVVGYSEADRGKKWVTRFQALDFLMLMIAARGSTNSGRAWASTGQNQAYRKTLFNSVGGFSQIAKELQGDDTLFLQVCRKNKSAKVVFADKSNCRIIARQETSWISFFKQRMRWAGDANLMWKFNPAFFISIFNTFLLPLLLVVTIFTGFFSNPYYFTVFTKFLTVHLIIEFILYFIGVRQFDKKIQVIDFTFWFMIHIPYIVCMGVGSFFAHKLGWRGR
ncbi:MAG TPA: glycosyltransferase [Candidatus Marinimicrobia bacterium]|nr:glycosyltransferase [Candidatus Neomarinimicrobiota bacterium]